MLQKLLKHLSIFIALLAKKSHLLIQLYLKATIKLVYFVTNNPFVYCLYIFSVMLTFFSNTELYYYHVFPALFCSYTFVQSLQLYILCNILVT